MSISPISNNQPATANIIPLKQAEQGPSFPEVLKDEQDQLTSKSDLRNNLKSLWGFEPKVPGQISLDELEFHGEKALQDFNKTLLNVLRSAGINTEEEILLGTECGTGKVIVENNHPDKEKIEKLLKENFELSNKYKHTTNMLHIAELGRRTEPFRQAYSVDPERAVVEYSYIFNSDLKPTVSLKSGAIDIMFEWIDKDL